MAGTPLPILSERKVTRLWNRIKACFQPKDADLTAIAALTGTSGLLKKTAANTWALHTSTLVTIAGTNLSLGGSITAATLGGALTKIGTASKGASNRPIYLNAGTPTAVTSVGEAFLSWGGQNFNGSYGPIDAAMVGVLGANRSAFANASGISVEYSRDSGTTWTDYGAAATTKTALFSGISAGLVIGKADSTNKATAAYKLRITLSTSAAGIYTVLNKFVIYLSTSGSTGCTCTITGRLQSNYEAGTETWVTFADKIPVSGWSGFNVINTSGITTYGNTKTSQYGQIRFLFECTGGSTSYNGLQVQYIQCFGGVGWTTPSTMASTGHMYTFDASKNVTFPAKVTASSFSGPLTGNVTGNCSGTAGSVAWSGVTGKPTIPTKTSQLTNDSGFITSTSNITGNAATASLATAVGTQSANFTYENINGIGQGLYDHTGDSTKHITAAERTAWNNKSTFSGAFSALTGKPTTLSGYGITDAKIANGTITLGGNTITPLTSHQSLAAIMGSTAKGDAVTPVYWTGSAWATCTTFANARVASAVAADKITNLTSTDQASSSTTWRRVWMCYTDNVNGRPAWTDGFVYQTSTNTLKTKKFLAVSASGEQQEFVAQRTGGSSVALMVGTGNANHGVYSITAAKWLIVSDASGNVTVNGNAASATKATQDGSGNTITSTYLKLAGGTLTGELTVKTHLLIDNYGSGAVAHLEFKREGKNFIMAPANGSINFCIGTAGKFSIYSDSVAPDVTNVTDLGSTSLKWRNVYAATFCGNLTGNAATATYAASIGSQDAHFTYENINGIGSALNSHTASTTLHVQQEAWQTLKSGTPGIKYRRIGKMIALKGYASITFGGNPSSPASVGTIASGYRPAAQTEFRCPVTVSSQSTLCFVQVQILTSGAVNLLVINGFGAPISSTVSWFADGLFFFID